MNLRDARRHRCCAVLFACILCVSCSKIASRAREEKNEADAAQRLRDVRSAERTFKGRHDRFGTLDDLVAAGVLGLPPASAAYRFSSSATATSYEITATPTKRDDAYAYVGWAFFLDESGVIRGAPYGKNNGYRIASKNDQPIRDQ